MTIDEAIALAHQHSLPQIAATLETAKSLLTKAKDFIESEGSSDDVADLEGLEIQDDADGVADDGDEDEDEG